MRINIIKQQANGRENCEKIIKKYPQFEDKIEWVLGPKRFSESAELEFSLPIKEIKIKKKKKGEEVTNYVPEFKNFKFEVEVLNRIVEW